MKRTVISLLCLAALLCAAIYFYYRNPAAELPPKDGDGPAVAKPVIYLYPEEETEVTVVVQADSDLHLFFRIEINHGLGIASDVSLLSPAGSEEQQGYEA
ncbi:hypothetical protein [uncultured Oscillibacter sp.]|uniref:hypothetical protein n=1 Tax=uncultured Oscillibacter sp. TaxID=876091 RepID=UPI00260D0170|nr:hypothetical protein [uncultured Oscillibacter sp.]